MIAVLALALASSGVRLEGAEEVFRDLSFEFALVDAEETDRVVMVDFFTTWCGPCKKLDRDTWPDERVRAWLEEHTVPLKVDAEQEVELARHYEVRSYPTIVFVDPSGKERGRVVGYRDPERFLIEAADALAGIGPVDRAREDSQAAGGKDPLLRGKLGRELAKAGQYDEALEEFLWCFEHGLEFNPSYHGVRLSYLLDEIFKLGRAYPPARKALAEMRNSRRAAFLEGTASSLEVQEFFAINRVIQATRNSLDAYDHWLQAEGRDEAWVAAILPTVNKCVLDLLIEAKRYENARAVIGEASVALDELLNRYRRFEEMGSDFLDSYRSFIVRQAGQQYEVLLGGGAAEDEVSAFLSKLLAFDSSRQTWDALVAHAARAGRADAVENLETARRDAESGR